MYFASVHFSHLFILLRSTKYNVIFPCSFQFVVLTVIKHTQPSDYIFCYQVKYDDKRLERAISLIQKSD